MDVNYCLNTQYKWIVKHSFWRTIYGYKLLPHFFRPFSLRFRPVKIGQTNFSFNIIIAISVGDTVWNIITCPACGRVFTGDSNRYVFQRHYKTVHLKIQKYSCCNCGRKFGHDNSRKRHEKICKIKDDMQNDLDFKFN